MVQPPNPPELPDLPQRPPWEDMQILIQRMDRLIRAFETGVGLPGLPGLPGIPGEPGAAIPPEYEGPADIIPFMKTIPSETYDDEFHQVANSGLVTRVYIAYPAGCQQLVSVRLEYHTKGGRHSIVPSEEDKYIALDDVTPVFVPMLKVEAPGQFKVEWWNYDELNEHSVPVIVEVLRRKASA